MTKAKAKRKAKAKKADEKSTPTKFESLKQLETEPEWTYL